MHEHTDEPIGSSDILSSNVSAMMAGLRSCQEIMSSQEHVKKWAEDKLKKEENLTNEETEKINFLIQSSTENIEKMRQQIQILKQSIEENSKK